MESIWKGCIKSTAKNFSVDTSQTCSYICSLLHVQKHLLIRSFHFRCVSLFYRKFGTCLILAYTLADDGALIRHPGVQDGQLVDTLVQGLDLDPVVLLHHLAGNHPLSSTVLISVRHLAFKGYFFLDVAFLILQRFEEFVNGSHPQGHLCLVAVGLALKQSCSLARNIVDDKHPLATVLHLLDLIVPVRVALEDLDSLVVPVDVALFVVDLAGDGASPVLDLTETLQLAREVAWSVWGNLLLAQRSHRISENTFYNHALN